MAPKLGQEIVRGLRADGMSEAAIREQLKAMGYKTGRVSQLLAATGSQRQSRRSRGHGCRGRDVAASDIEGYMYTQLSPCSVLNDKGASGVKPAVAFLTGSLGERAGPGRLGEGSGPGRGWAGPEVHAGVAHIYEWFAPLLGRCRG